MISISGKGHIACGLTFFSQTYKRIAHQYIRRKRVFVTQCNRSDMLMPGGRKKNQKEKNGKTIVKKGYSRTTRGRRQSHPTLSANPQKRQCLRKTTDGLPN
jgi:hypothetical protein